jgi:2-haloacid dehalogenase/putative hydrolase of the HAD superfamily
MQLSDFNVLTSDCHGTLIDWGTGVMKALEPLLVPVDRPIRRGKVRAAFARHDTDASGGHPRSPIPNCRRPCTRSWPRAFP